MSFQLLDRSILGTKDYELVLLNPEYSYFYVQEFLLVQNIHYLLHVFIICVHNLYWKL